MAQLTTAAINTGIVRAALDDTVSFVREHARPWIDTGVSQASEDPLIIYHIGIIDSRLVAAETLLELAGNTIDLYKSAPDDKMLHSPALRLLALKS